MGVRAGKPRSVRGLHVARLELATPHLHPAHNGLTLAHLTDLHFAGDRVPRRLEAAVELANAAATDVTVLTGDYVCFSARKLTALRRVLGQLRGQVFATLGNHDHWTDPDAIADALGDAGITVLRNAHATITVRGAPLHVVGLDDHVTKNADAELAFRALARGGTRVVLSHDPKGADLLAGRDAAIILSGHTHGGQVYIPGVTRALARRAGMRYLVGLYDVGGSPLYVNKGVGNSLPLRLGARSELALITLRPARPMLLAV
jgi:predicted MPP superfamily phosphohydrolase